MRKITRKETGIKNDTGIETDIETRTLKTEIKNERETRTRTSIEIETNATKTGTEGRIKTEIENTAKDQGSEKAFMKTSQA